MDPNITSFITLALSVLTIFIVIQYVFQQKAKASIQKWAKENNYTIEKQKYCFARPGPYFGYRISGMYRLSVRNTEGEIKKVWIGYGVGFFGCYNPGKLSVVFDSDLKEDFSKRMLYWIYLFFLGCIFLLVIVNFSLIIANNYIP